MVSSDIKQCHRQKEESNEINGIVATEHRQKESDVRRQKEESNEINGIIIAAV